MMAGTAYCHIGTRAACGTGQGGARPAQGLWNRERLDQRLRRGTQRPRRRAKAPYFSNSTLACQTTRLAIAEVLNCRVKIGRK